MNPTPRGADRPRLVVLKGVTRPVLLPYVILVALLLTAGSVALLLLNTALNSGDITRQRLEQQQTGLDQRTDELRQQLQQESAPNALAARATRLGMVPVPGPAFLDPTTGGVLGDARRATAPPSPTPPTGGDGRTVPPEPPGSAGAAGSTNSPAAFVLPGTAGQHGGATAGVRTIGAVTTPSSPVSGAASTVVPAVARRASVVAVPAGRGSR